jgi:hypothetical protein
MKIKIKMKNKKNILKSEIEKNNNISQLGLKNVIEKI